MKIGVLCPSDIAFRRFLPALSKIDEMEFVGVGINSAYERYGKNIPNMEEVKNMLNRENKKASQFVENYGGKIFKSYESMILSKEIEAVYIPLPPALHFEWSKKALENGKHVLVEKPATINANETKKLVEIANKRNLAFHENYMFQFHKQISEIDHIIESNKIGDVRLYRLAFGFPQRMKNDFRYNKALGGGALIDAGGYTLKYASYLLGGNGKLKSAQLSYKDEFDVDIAGSGMMCNDKGQTVQFAFGMDNSYKCELEVWGSKGVLYTDRIFTAPDGFVPSMKITIENEIEEIELSSDDTFKKSICHFMCCIKSEKIRNENYREIIEQAELVDKFRKISENAL